MSFHTNLKKNFLMKYTLLACICSFIFSAQLFGQEIKKEFRTSDGFSIFLTNNWKEIPKDILEESAKAYAEATKMDRQYYDYGFQLTSSQNWLQYPYILIQVKKSGRIPDSQLKKYKTLETDMQKGLQEAEKKSVGLLSDSKLGETYYDSENHILFTLIKMNVQSIGTVVGLTAVKLTEEGFIQFSGYAIESVADKYISFFKDAVRQIKLQDHLVYKPRLTDSVPIISSIDWSKVGEKALIGAIIGGLMSAIALMIRKIKKG